ncbi:hypothetical protein AB1Y20_011092 [Prymnesium parvum]|uniref:Uncharacterized protein n=1 Tax=Prymnesium parvum TaxID=97485 RepID=A0AB34INZ8_PRYPA
MVLARLRQVLTSLRQLRQLEKETPARIQQTLQRDLENAKLSERLMEEKRKAWEGVVATLPAKAQAFAEHAMEQKLARIQAQLERIQVDERSLKKQATLETVESWSTMLKTSRIMSASDKSADGSTSEADGEAESRKPAAGSKATSDATSGRPHPEPSNHS